MMWSLSKSRRRHDRWGIALAKWGPKAASKCWRNGIHISPCHYFQAIGHYPFLIGSWLRTTLPFSGLSNIFVFILKILSYFRFMKKKTGLLQTPFIIRCDLSTFSFWGEQSLSEQKQRWGRRESPHNFYVVESAKGVCYFWGSLLQPPWHTTGCPEIHCDASQQN
jgi:hypothetical protein